MQRIRLFIGLVLFCLASIGAYPLHGQASATAGQHKYGAEVTRIQRDPRPAPNGILMIGSSIFRKWTTFSRDLAPLPVINRAISGSCTDDQLYYFSSLVPSSRASLVVWYCGSNDVTARFKAKYIIQNTREWIRKTLAALPQARIVLVSVLRSPAKREAGLLDVVDQVNKGLSTLAQSNPKLVYADVNPSMETPAGRPLIQCYVQDKNHLTSEGYRRMTLALKPVIQRTWKRSRI